MPANGTKLPKEAFVAWIVPRGDGAYSVTPLPSVRDETTLDGELWVSAEKAANLLAPCSRASIYRFADEGLIEDHYPSPGRRLFGVKSILKLKDERQSDREFWSSMQRR